MQPKLSFRDSHQHLRRHSGDRLYVERQTYDQRHLRLTCSLLHRGTHGHSRASTISRALRSDLLETTDRAAAGEHRSTLEITELFPTDHVSQLPPGLALYFPFGIALASLRMLVWVALLAADQPWLTNNDMGIKALQSLLGLSITWKNLEMLPRQRHTIVSNHVTTGDLMVLYSLLQPTIHLVSAGLPKQACQAHNHRVQLRVATPASYNQLASSDSRESVHLFPEGGMTNGKGMMTFSRGFMRFAQGMPVVPVALRADIPWGLSTHTRTSSFLANLFWFCFPPVVRLEATVLPALREQEGESKAEFVQRVQQCIADELQIPIVDYNIQQKHQWIQRLRKGSAA